MLGLGKRNGNLGSVFGVEWLEREGGGCGGGEGEGIGARNGGYEQLEECRGRKIGEGGFVYC